MARRKLTLSINETLAIMREAGVPASGASLADGIESGAYPFGRLVRKSESGRRTFEIFVVDLRRWLEEKTPKEER